MGQEWEKVVAAFQSDIHAAEELGFVSCSLTSTFFT